MNTEPHTDTERQISQPAASKTPAEADERIHSIQSGSLDTPVNCDEFPKALTDKYEIIQKTGQGAQADVYLAINRSDQKKVAIKQLHIESLKSWKQYELFYREAEVLRSLDISGVAHYYDFFDALNDTNPSAYIVQEYIEGSTLYDLINKKQHFPQERIYHFAIQLLNILHSLHNHKPCVIHRDIKPSNIMIKEDDTVYLIDFGAVANPQVQNGGSTVAGTYGYMPPEQLMGHPEAASDIYAMAAVLIYLLTGVPPEEMPVLDLELQFENYVQNVPEAVSLVIRRMLSANPQNRLCDEDKLIELFEQFQNGDFDLKTDDILYRAANMQPQKKTRNYIKKEIEVYQKRLNNVRHICQSGNLELWQLLSADNMPKSYKESFLKYTPELLAFSIPIIIFPVGYYFISGSPEVLFALLLLCVVFFVAILKSNAGLASLKNIPKFYKRAGKCIAEIIDIQYVPSDIIRRKNVPTFKVVYRFSVPGTSQKVTHEFPSHTTPEGHYAVGDQLPILYEDLPNVIRSMPFPFSKDNVLNDDKLICETIK
ncbi:MAG: serine/threonine protein kinase [Proteobacteria bacterium]|nr:serine/threonine protein kinase [Pseudomonadota bacterium]